MLDRLTREQELFDRMREAESRGREVLDRLLEAAARGRRERPRGAVSRKTPRIAAPLAALEPLL